VTDQKRALDALHLALPARDQAAEALRLDSEMKNARIQSLITAQIEQAAALQAARDDLAANVQTIQEQAAELRAARDELAAKTQQIADLGEKLAALQGSGDDVSAKDQRIADLTQTLAMTESDLDYKIALTLTLANAAYDALLVLDQDKRVIAINNSAETLFGRQRPIGEALVDVTGSPEIESIVDDALIYQEETFEDQTIYNKRSYRVRAQMIHRDDNTFLALALADITDLVRLNRARRDMVANISHELRTPITNIRLTIDGIFHEQDKPKGKASRSALKDIARETDSLLWLVQELLDLSMIESGQAILRMVEVPADMLVNEAIERLVDQSETKSLTMVSHVPGGVQVLCDRDQARRVLINLIHNAIKWSPENGTIQVDVTPGEEEITFAVLDEGPGVPDEFRERIFERFYQVDPSRSGGEGTGLGLAICKHIVEAHGGRIWAEGNSNGGGGRFLFTLPSATVPVENADTPEFA
jgi:two-component system phosphate regulon sensor histidine kinase PhoR